MERTPVRLALASQRDLPDWEIDDRPLHAALAARGARVEQPAWDDPGVAWGRYDAVLLRTTWDYAARRDAFVEWLWTASGATRIYNRPRVCEWNTHKGYLLDLEREGVPIAPTAWLRTGQRVDVASLMAERGWSRGFLKPVFGQTARETLRGGPRPPPPPAAQAHLDRLLPSEGLMLQPYLSRVETEGEFSVVFVDGRACHGVRKVPVAGDYRVQDDFGASDGPWSLPDEVVELSRFAMASAEVHLALEEPLLYGRADWLRTDPGDWVLTELEVVEPSMFFRHGPQTAERLAEALLDRVRA